MPSPKGDGRTTPPVNCLSRPTSSVSRAGPDVPDGASRPTSAVSGAGAEGGSQSRLKPCLDQSLPQGVHVQARSNALSVGRGGLDCSASSRSRLKSTEAERLHQAIREDLAGQTHHLEEFLHVQLQTVAEFTSRVIEEQNRRSRRQHHEETSKIANAVEKKLEAFNNKDPLQNPDSCKQETSGTIDRLTRQLLEDELEQAVKAVDAARSAMEFAEKASLLQLGRAAAADGLCEADRPVPRRRGTEPLGAGKARLPESSIAMPTFLDIESAEKPGQLLLPEIPLAQADVPEPRVEMPGQVGEAESNMVMNVVFSSVRVKSDSPTYGQVRSEESCVQISNSVSAVRVGPDSEIPVQVQPKDSFVHTSNFDSQVRVESDSPIKFPRGNGDSSSHMHTPFPKSSGKGSCGFQDAVTQPETPKPKEGAILRRVHSQDSQATTEGPTAGKQFNGSKSFEELRHMYGILDSVKTSKRKSVLSLEGLNADQRASCVTKWRCLCQKIVMHRRFEPVMSVAMLLCAVAMAADTDYNLKAALDGTGSSHIVFQVLDKFFNIWFSLEMTVRWGSDGLCFFFSCQNPSVRWNCMDCVLVSSAWIEEVVTAVANGVDGVNLSSLRILRMMRLIRVGRLLRMLRFFSELRVMVNGVLGSARSLLWALILLMLVMFMVGVTIMQMASMYLQDETFEHAAATANSIREHYGSVDAAVMTLYASISGGIDWRDAAGPFSKMGWIGVVLSYLLAGYVFFTVFCCLNIVTGIFVDNAKALKQADEEAMFQEAVNERKRWIGEVAELFSKVALEKGNQNGFTYEVLKEKLEDIRVQALFAKLGINTDTTSPEELWEIFDIDDTGEIDQEKFARGMRHFTGNARSIDVYRLRKDTLHLSRDLQELTSIVLSLASSLERKGLATERSLLQHEQLQPFLPSPEPPRNAEPPRLVQYDQDDDCNPSKAETAFGSVARTPSADQGECTSVSQS
eukprot:TRINITY_DN20101_c0_g2_i1.p1 TRINITY_DN20101_c0_g2~~TRINITY_DN20101_c0_g2_i1.p1  ORF type:complete len:967 (+),score=193.18 TRINITY_DN20101_c0_g2_i1:21-2921(+)